jgi:hypothetical protein
MAQLQTIVPDPVSWLPPLTPGDVAMMVTGSNVECRQVAVPLVLSWLLLMGTSPGSDVDQVTEKRGKAAGDAQPAGTIWEVPNCWESLAVPWFKVALSGKTESAVGLQLVVVFAVLLGAL